MRFLGIFTDGKLKFQFIAIAAILVLFTLSGQLVIKHMTDDYKQNMIAHDYGTAGYLARGGSENVNVAQAFTSDKNQNDIQTGRELLQASGYTFHIQNSLLPEVERFHRKFAVISLALSVVFSVVILSVILYYAFLRDKKIEKANST